MNDARRDMMRLVRELESSGFEVSRTGSGHWKVQPPEGAGVVFMSFSPRTSAFHKTLKRLKEIGYNP